MRRVQFGTLAVVAIVALRLGVGLHFFWQGTDKLVDPKPFSAGFLGNAKGPLAPLYRRMVWDADGRYRLDPASMTQTYEQFGHQIANHYGFDEGQRSAANKIVDNHIGQYKSFRGSRGEEIEEYYNQLERRDENTKNPSRAALASMRAHDARIETERNKLRGEVLPEIDRISKDLEENLNDLATEEQWKRHGRLAIGKPGRRMLDSETIDKVIPYFDLAVGLCLILGLFTRPAAIAGGLFLLSVCLSQWPGAVGAVSIEYQAIEMLSLFALAAIGAGQFAGFDFVLSGARRLCCPPKNTTGAQA
jgi:uncharacterized membrane protein YphA (DoxX/SURF4 family)